MNKKLNLLLEYRMSCKKKPVVVVKFGGTSVSSLESWLNIMKMMLKLQTTHKIIMVVSALQGITDLLEQFSKKNEKNENDKMELSTAIFEKHLNLLNDLGINDIPIRLYSIKEELDDYIKYSIFQWEKPERIARIISLGEYMSSIVAETILKSFAFHIQLVHSGEIIYAPFDKQRSIEDNYYDMNIDCSSLRQSKKKLNEYFIENDIILTQGFVCAIHLGDDYFTNALLGRGGSDTTGAILANIIDAEQYIICKDVDGVYNEDPRKNKHAHFYTTLTYEEAQQISNNGAKVLHKKCIEPLKDKHIPCIVRNLNITSKKHTIIQN